MSLAKLRSVLCLLFGAGIFVLLILAINGTFSAGIIEPARLSLPPPLQDPELTVFASREQIAIWYEAVGTVQSETRVNIASQVTGVVLEIRVVSGDTVHTGEVLIRLEDRELQSRRIQALEAKNAAVAALKQAETEYARILTLAENRRASQRDQDAALSSFQQAEAGMKRAAEMAEEAEVALGHATLRASSEGIVDRRLAEPGDLAYPGKVLLLLHNPEKLRLEANVREGMIGQLSYRDSVGVTITARQADLTGVVAEIIPSADPISRSFSVKVDLPPHAGLFPGMFGKLRLQIGWREAVLVPAQAVRTVGQLNTVLVRETDGAWRRRFVSVGGMVDEERLEILSGLDGGEPIGLR